MTPCPSMLQHVFYPGLFLFLQVVGFGSNRTYSGMWTCFRDVVEQQGVLALYRGATASLLKALVVTGITFFVYEQVLDACHEIQLKRSSSSSGNVTQAKINLNLRRNMILRLSSLENHVTQKDTDILTVYFLPAQILD